MDRALGTAIDSAGNLYVAGSFSGTATFGATTLTATVGFDLFLAKLSPTGTWLWARDVEPGFSGIYPLQLEIDSTGSVILMTTVAGDTATDGLNMVYLARFTSAGETAWAKKYRGGTLASVLGGSMALDAANNIYVVGSFGARVDLAGMNLGGIGNGDAFIAKVSVNGFTQAAARFGQTGPIPDEGRGVALDAAGNIYLAMNFGGTLTAGSTTLTAAGETDVALLKLDPALNPVAAYRFGGDYADEVFRLTRSSANQFYLLGRFSEFAQVGGKVVTPNLAGQNLVAQFGGDGAVAWLTSLGDNFLPTSGSVGFVTDASGNLLVASGRAVIKVQPSGAIHWARGITPTFGASELAGVAVQNYTNVFVVGTFGGNATLDGTTLTSAGGDDALVARLLIDTTPPPVITVPPRDQSVLAGATVTFTVAATGAGPLTYQWFYGNQAITGATNASLQLTNVATIRTGVYWATVGNAGGSTPSAMAQLTVNLPPPTITQPPQNLTVEVGGEAQFTVTATGSGPLFYQWQLRGTNLPQQITSLLVLRGVTAADGGPYRVLVGNSAGYTTSVVATLTVRTVAPTITVQPHDEATQEGATVSFSVGTTGSPPMTYRWTRNGILLPAATGPTLVLQQVQQSDVGSYQVTVSNAAGSVTSAPAALALTRPDLTGEPFTWGLTMAGVCRGDVVAMTTDDLGNLYLVGNQPDMALPGLPSSTQGCRFGIVIAKLDADGRGLWRTAANGNSGTQINVARLAVDAAGNVWLAGYYSGVNIFFGSFSLGTGGGLLFAKLSPVGEVLWVKRVPSAFATDLVLDDQGNAFLGGTLAGSATAAFGSTNITSARPRPFLAKSDAQGNFTWVRPAGAQTQGAQGAALGRDRSGDLWLLGDFAGKFELGTNLLDSPSRPPFPTAPRYSTFLARFDSNTGLPRWVRKYETDLSLRAGHLVSPGPDDSAVVWAETDGAFRYPPATTPEGLYGSLLFRVDALGNPTTALLSERHFQGASANPAGEVVVSVNLEGSGPWLGFPLKSPNGQRQAVLLRLNPDLTSELVRSVTGWKGVEYAAAGPVAIAPNGDAFLAGGFGGTNVVFGSVVNRPAFGSGGFLAKLAGEPAADLPHLTAAYSPERRTLALTWPASAGWVLERAGALGAAFLPLPVTPVPDATGTTVRVELSLDGQAGYFRLRH